jgi:hypothetical protein
MHINATYKKPKRSRSYKKKNCLLVWWILYNFKSLKFFIRLAYVSMRALLVMCYVIYWGLQNIQQKKCTIQQIFHGIAFYSTSSWIETILRGLLFNNTPKKTLLLMCLPPSLMLIYCALIYVVLLLLNLPYFSPWILLDWEF